MCGTILIKQPLLIYLLKSHAIKECISATIEFLWSTSSKGHDFIFPSKDLLRIYKIMYAMIWLKKLTWANWEKKLGTIEFLKLFDTKDLLWNNYMLYSMIWLKKLSRDNWAKIEFPKLFDRKGSKARNLQGKSIISLSLVKIYCGITK